MNQTHQAGSDQNPEPAYALIGQFRRTHGLKGEISFAQSLPRGKPVKAGRILYVGTQKQPVTVEAVRPKPPLWLVKLSGVDDPESAQRLVNEDVFLPVKDLPRLSKGEYYEHELVGLEVFEEETLLGKLTEVLLTGANDVYVIQQPDETELLIPAIPDVILQVDVANGRMQVRLLPGLRSDG